MIFVNVNEELLNRLGAAPVVPLVVPDDPETAIKTTQALGSVFKDVKFMPTGGVSAANLADYLALPLSSAPCNPGSANSF